MGVFEFVLAIIFMSFVFKVIKLRYESKENDQPSGDANALGLNSAVEKQEQRVPNGQRSKGAFRETVNSASPWQLLFFAACVFVSIAFFLLASLMGWPAVTEGPPVAQSAPAMPLEIQEVPEAPPISEAVPIPPNATALEKEPNEAPDEFIADVYPSIVDCGAPMAIKVYNEISDRLPTVPPHEAEDSDAEKEEDNQNKIAEKETPEPTEFYITNEGLSEQDYLPFVVAFRKKIEAKVENSSVKDITGRALVNLKQPPKSHYRIVVSRLPKAPNGQKPYTGGQLVCKVMGKDFSIEVMTPFLKKLWLTDYEAFSKKNPGTHYIVGHADGFFPTESQALKQALTNCDLDAWNMAGLAGNGYLDGRQYLQIDKLVQKYDRPYGDVFRCSVLLQGDQDRSAEMAYSVPKEASQPTLLSSLFNCGWNPSFEWSIALLIGLTVVIGTISNALTQGYYRTEISWSKNIIVLVCFLVLLLIGLAGIGFEM